MYELLKKKKGGKEEENREEGRGRRGIRKYREKARLSRVEKLGAYNGIRDVAHVSERG